VNLGDLTAYDVEPEIEEGQRPKETALPELPEWDKLPKPRSTHTVEKQEKALAAYEADSSPYTGPLRDDRRWRRVALDMGADTGGINLAVDRLMRERPYANSGRVMQQGQRGRHRGLELDVDTTIAYDAVADGTLTGFGRGTPQHGRRRPNKPFHTIRHGTISAYQNDKCRCDECKSGWRDYQRRLRRRARENA